MYESVHEYVRAHEVAVVYWFLFTILVVILPPIIAVLVTDDVETIGPGQYFVKSVKITIGSLILGILPLFLDLRYGVYFSLLITGFLNFMVGMWTVHRVTDIGWPKKWALLYAVPVVGMFFWVTLLFCPSQYARA